LVGKEGRGFVYLGTQGGEKNGKGRIGSMKREWGGHPLWGKGEGVRANGARVGFQLGGECGMGVKTLQG